MKQDAPAWRAGALEPEEFTKKAKEDKVTIAETHSQPRL